MLYGTIHVDNIVFDNGGADETVTVSGLYVATTSGVTVSGTIAANTVSGTTVTGGTASFTSGTITNLTSATATITGALVIDNQQQVRFREATASGTNFIALQAPVAVTSDKTITLPDVTGTVVTTGDTGSVSNEMLATISTAGKVDNSATTATDANTASAIVARSASGNFNTTSINSGPLAGFRNAIINGNFDFWQRGTSFTASNYGSDRWFHAAVGSTQSVTRQPFTLGQTDVPGEPLYFCRTVVISDAGVGNYVLLAQRLEGVRSFTNQQVTVSFWAKADSTKNISIDLQQFFGSGGSPSTTVNGIGAVKVSINTSWQKITMTTTLPSLSGKTIGTSNNDMLQLDIWFEAGSTWNTSTDSLGQQSGTFDIAQVQIEPGPVATPFEKRPQQVELALCQRYFCITKALTRFRSAVINQITETPIYWPVQMRVNPFNITVTAGSRLNIAAVIVQSDIGTTGARHIIIASAANSDTYSFNDIITADAEI